MTHGDLLISCAALKRPSIPPSDSLGSSSLGVARQFLAHPLPSGMRDLLPGEAAAQERLVSAVLNCFELHGFQQVGLPTFEYTDVLERGLGAIDPHSILRFVEPESGEIVALRPDMTPQVARLVAMRLVDGPFPARLSYRGSVLRRRHERARHDQEVLQAGIELIGAHGLAADREVLRATTTAVRQAGLTHFVLDLGHGAISAALLTGLPSDLRSELLEALSLKDQAELVKRAEAANLDREQVKRLAALVELHGSSDVFERARRALGEAVPSLILNQLETLYQVIEAEGLASQIVVDLGETHAIPYYTGMMFQILAEGPGQAVASGGRYDGLLARFALQVPAAGAAIHVDHLRWAVGGGCGQELRVLVVPADSESAAQTLVERLRTEKIPSVVAESNVALDYARGWRYSHIVRMSKAGSVRLSQIVQGQEQELGEFPLEAIVQRVSQ